MAQNVLACLTLAGVIERAGPRRATLRVTPRFLAHAEGTAGRIHTMGLALDDIEILTQALQTWDDFHDDGRHGARFLHQVLCDRNQMGALRPVFPALESFVAAA